MKRVGYIDLAAGILILWIMSFHAMNNAKVFGETDARVALPYLVFSMPWFFYKSGSFFNPSRGTAGIAKDAKKLLLPFLKWGAAGYAVHLAMMAIDGTFDVSRCITEPLEKLFIFGYIPINVPLWFLLSLFLSKILAQFLLRTRVLPEVWIVICLAVPYVLHLTSDPRIPVYLSNIPMGAAFLITGYRFSKYEDRKWLFAVCAAAFAAMIALGAPIVGLHRNVHLSGEYLLWPLFGYCGIVTFNNLCRIICGKVDWKFRPLSLIGEKSLFLLITHALIYMPVIHYSGLFPLSPVEVFCLIEAGYVLILLPWVLFRRNSTAKQ